jgi:hypothetical protein
LRAARAFEERETILVAKGDVGETPGRHSLQIGSGEHLKTPPDAAPGEHPWRFVNHACSPNAAFIRRRLIALRRIDPGEEITFDYETTEWELASPFRCSCGGPGCMGREIRGFRHLPDTERRRRIRRLRPELRRLVDEAPVASGGTTDSIPAAQRGR